MRTTLLHRITILQLMRSIQSQGLKSLQKKLLPDVSVIIIFHKLVRTLDNPNPKDALQSLILQSIRKLKQSTDLLTMEMACMIHTPTRKVWIKVNKSTVILHITAQILSTKNLNTVLISRAISTRVNSKKTMLHFTKRNRLNLILGIASQEKKLT